MSIPEAAKLLGISRSSMQRIVRAGRVASIQVPGMRTRRLLREDVEQLARASIRPATVASGES